MPADGPTRIGAWVLATLAVYSVVWPYHIAAAWRALPAPVGGLLWIPLASSLVVAPLTLSFFLVFPRRLVHGRAAWMAIWTPAALLLIPQVQFIARAVYEPNRTGGFVDLAGLQL